MKKLPYILGYQRKRIICIGITTLGRNNCDAWTTSSTPIPKLSPIGSMATSQFQSRHVHESEYAFLRLLPNTNVLGAFEVLPRNVDN